MGREALRARWRDSTRSSPSPRSWSTDSRARPSRSSSGGGTPSRSESPAGRAAQLMQILREWRGGLHLVATTAVGLVPPRGDPDQRGPGPGEVLRVGRALPGLRTPSRRSTTRPRRSPTGSARRPWQTRSTLRGTRTSKRGSPRCAPLPRRPPGASSPGVGRNPGQARVKGCSAAGGSPDRGAVAIATDLWCSSECTPPCQGGGRGFKSRQVRCQAPTPPTGGRSLVTRSGSSVGRARA